MQVVQSKTDEIPPELKGAYDALYKKIAGLVAGNTVVDLRSDPTTVRIIIEAAMSIVEQCRGADGNTWSGPEKKRYAITIIKYVLRDLAANGKLDPVAALELSQNIDFFGGIAMDVAVDAIKGMFNIGQSLTRDVPVMGCKAACAKDCCNII